MKILINEMLPEFQKLHPDCDEVSWNKKDGVSMSLLDKWGRRSLTIKDFDTNQLTYDLLIKTQKLVDDFLQNLMKPYNEINNLIAVPFPTSQGLWHNLNKDPDDSDVTVEVYPLEPANNILCVWGPDIGLSYAGAVDSQECWTTDEFQGHIPVTSLCMKGNWIKVVED